MQMNMRSEGTLRRDVLQLLGASALSLALPGPRLRAASRSGTKTLRGIFPIASTPFTESDKLDLDALSAEVKFMDRGGVHGFVWPQNWSEWRTLTERERFDGAEAILSAGKVARLAIVIGIQGPDVATAVRYARHAGKLGADGVISLPPGEDSDPVTILEYYKEVAKATELPFFAQAVGKMTVDLLLDMYKSIPNFRYVKDEAAGSPLKRIIPLREKTSDQLKMFFRIGRAPADRRNAEGILRQHADSRVPRPLRPDVGPVARGEAQGSDGHARQGAALHHRIGCPGSPRPGHTGVGKVRPVLARSI
jgi:hypothetical protein